MSILIIFFNLFFFCEFAFAKLTSSYSKQLFKLAVEIDKKANTFNQVLLRLSVKFRQDFEHLILLSYAALKIIYTY